MELADITTTLSRQRRWIAYGAVVACVIAWATTFKVAFPPTQARSIEFGAASTQVLIDARRSPLVDLAAEFDPLATRAEVYARLVESEPVRNLIIRKARLDPAEVIIGGRTSSSSTRSAREPTAEQRAKQLAGDGTVKRILFAAEEDLPVISIYAQADTPSGAIRLADAGAAGLIEYAAQLQRRDATPRGRRVELRQLGASTGELVNPGAGKAMAAIVFVLVLGFWTAGLIVVSNAASAFREEACRRCEASVPPEAKFCAQCGLAAGALAVVDRAERYIAPGNGAQERSAEHDAHPADLQAAKLVLDRLRDELAEVRGAGSKATGRPR